MTRVSMVDLIRDVRIALDENAEQSSYIQSNADNLELDDIIGAKLPEAARDVTEQADVEMLEPETMATVLTVTDGGGRLTVPDDFLRLVSLKMKEWNRSVTVVAGEGSDIELMQRNRYTRGTAMKPVCVTAFDASGKKVLEFFGKGTVVERALYMPIPAVENGYLPISRLLRQAIVRRTAGLVLLSRGETERAAAFMNP